MALDQRRIDREDVRETGEPKAENHAASQYLARTIDGNRDSKAVSPTPQTGHNYPCDFLLVS
jgi:hypothetical protein